MTELFSDEWMSALKDKWNNEPKVVDPLKKADFTATIAYGFKGEPKPRGVMVVQNGVVTKAGSYGEEPLDWDLRADRANWKLWIETGFGLTRLGPAVAMKKLEFAQGNYRQMIRNPALSHPFLKHFDLMGELKTRF